MRTIQSSRLAAQRAGISGIENTTAASHGNQDELGQLVSPLKV